MVKLTDIVLKDLKSSGADTETLELWNSITQWYEEGGPDIVEEGIMEKMKDIRSIANRQIKETKEVVPKRKKIKKTRR